MRASRRRLLALAPGVVLLAGLQGCRRTPSASSEIGFAEGDGSFTRVAPDDRRPAPVLSGVDLAGKPLSTADHAGKVLVLNVWASWCGPCRKEAPGLVEAAKQTADVAQFLGINTRDNTQAATRFAAEFGITYPNFDDPDGTLLLDFRDLPPTAIPTTLVVDGQGRVAARVLGEATASTLAAMVTDVAAGK